ncbi:hypothetical protein M378DRAFT_65395 [Amanita muscaria Koide BX008]|uniref:Uncharacterized protein n=1 Tax=Amanita muscaria (strain Koide BX008) TaxID=946122 RepID=A0A0C2T5F2_AMAMK|nr:hypothetical protein M378DRAFT_65395 [Amanita muscaria Koide BX008]
MASDASSQEITINIKGPSELKLQITISTVKTVLELKQAIAARSDVPAERQRLIYSGRVLKDDDQLSTYKIQSSHTIHMVKGVARTGGPSTQTSTTPQQLPAMQAGQNPHDPLTLLNSHMGFGAMAGLNPFSDMGLNPNDPNMMQTMMNSPQFMQQITSLLANPEILDQLIAANPQLAAMGPQVRAAFQSPQFRELLANPERLQQIMQMANTFRQAGINPMSNPFGGSSLLDFPPPGSPSAPGTPTATTTNNTATANPTQPPGSPGATGTTTTATTPAQPQPFNLFAAAAGARANPIGLGSPGTGIRGQQSPTSPFAFDPALMQQLFGSGNGGMGGLGGLGGLGGSTAPADARPPEERFEVQLRQLQEMGFTNAAQNIRALQATGGNVHSAIEYILSGGGLL